MRRSVPPAPRPSGAPLAVHGHPQPRLRRLSALLIALGLAGAGIGVAGLALLGLIYRLPLLVLAAGFLAILALPLVQLAVMHPQITVYAEGLWLQPLLGRGTWVPWAAIVRLAEHTLIQRGTTKAGQRARGPAGDRGGRAALALSDRGGHGGPGLAHARLWHRGARTARLSGLTQGCAATQILWFGLKSPQGRSAGGAAGPLRCAGRMEVSP